MTDTNAMRANLVSAILPVIVRNTPPVGRNCAQVAEDAADAILALLATDRAAGVGEDTLEPCAFVDCPPGLFRWSGLLCFKSEYSSKPGQQDAYCVDSGEYFWGGTNGDLEKRRSLIVTPVAATSPPAPADAGKCAICDGPPHDPDCPYHPVYDALDQAAPADASGVDPLLCRCENARRKGMPMLCVQCTGPVGSQTRKAADTSPADASGEVERLREALEWIKRRCDKLRKGTDDWFDLVDIGSVASGALNPTAGAK